MVTALSSQLCVKLLPHYITQAGERTQKLTLPFTINRACILHYVLESVPARFLVLALARKSMTTWHFPGLLGLCI